MNSKKPLAPYLSHISERINEKIDSASLEVPMLPEVAGKVVRLTQDPDSDASQLAKLIQSDQPLAGHVMRVANSSAYSPNGSIVSLQQAITRLGIQLISDIALGASVNSKLFNTPGFEHYVQEQMECSLSSALWAKEVARACRSNVEASFLLGLLHNIGRPVTVQCSLEFAQEQDLQLSLEDINALENIHQLAIGINVLEQWKMPSTVCEVMKNLEDYSQAGQVRDQTMIVLAGSLLAQQFSQNPEDSYKTVLESLTQQNVFADLNLYQDEVAMLLEKREQIQSAVEAMKQ